MVDVSDPQVEAAADEARATPAPAPPAGKQKRAAEPPPAPKQTVEHWAALKGFSPERLPSAPAPAGNIPLGSPMNPKFWMFAGAKAGMKWPEGAEVTEAEFDAAIQTVTTGVSR